MDREWHTSTPDGREVVVQRHGDLWLVRCGHYHALSTNLDVALMNAIRADPEIVAHSDEADYPAWARGIADKLDSAT